MNKVITYLSLGSNIDDRLDYLDTAKENLKKHPEIKILSESRIYETEPWLKKNKEHPYAEKGQKWFLNQVIKIETSFDPEKLLKVIQKIESDLGRTKKHHYGPREIDIDILLYNNEVIDLPHLQIPHRHMNDRLFVLVPLIELNPDIKDPISKKTYKNLMKAIKDEYDVIPFL